MKTITIKGGIYFDTEYDKYGVGQKYKFFNGSLSPFSTYLPICEHTIVAEFPDDFDPSAAEVEALRAERKKAEKAFADTVRQIDQRINSLLAIGCATEVA